MAKPDGLLAICMWCVLAASLHAACAGFWDAAKTISWLAQLKLAGDRPVVLLRCDAGLDRMIYIGRVKHPRLR